jgi:exopolyphosphatase/guanosine-5'-triphosphate,3'-diphosphate pyrophosphatase
LVLSGIETAMVLKMLGRTDAAKLTVVSIREFTQLADRVSRLNIPQLMKEFDLTEQRAEIVLPTLLLYYKVMIMSDVSDIIISNAQFSDGITISHIGEKVEDKWMERIEAQIVSLARSLGRKYNCDPQHTGSVEQTALLLYDRLTKVHGLGRRERFLLKLTSILHNIGKFVSLRTHYFYSYRLILSSDIIGCSEDERAIIANVAYYNSGGTPSNADPNFAALSPEQRITVSKLAAIFRLADAIDRSHLQKVTIRDISLNGEEFIVAVSADQDISLEEWAFDNKAEFFESVFGIKAILQRQAG